MPLEDREAIVATVQETYVLMGRAISANVPAQIVERALRRDVVEQLVEAQLDDYVTDEEMLGYLREVYLELVRAVIEIEDALLGELGEELDPALERAGLTRSGRDLKVNAFRRSVGRLLEHVPGVRRIKKAFKWGNIILGSLGSVPVVGIAAEPIKELKESIEAQGDEDQGDED